MRRYARSEVDEAIEAVARNRWEPHSAIVLAAEVEALRAEVDPVFASDAEKDVDYWRLKASEHFTAFTGAHAAIVRVEGLMFEGQIEDCAAELVRAALAGDAELAAVYRSRLR